MKMVRNFAIAAALHNFAYEAKWLSTKMNLLSDLLSRDNVSLFQELAPWAQPSPDPLPDMWLT